MLEEVLARVISLAVMSIGLLHYASFRVDSNHCKEKIRHGICRSTLDLMKWQGSHRKNHISNANDTFKMYLQNISSTSENSSVNDENRLDKPDLTRSVDGHQAISLNQKSGFSHSLTALSQSWIVFSNPISTLCQRPVIFRLIHIVTAGLQHLQHYCRGTVCSSNFGHTPSGLE